MEEEIASLRVKDVAILADVSIRTASRRISAIKAKFKVVGRGITLAEYKEYYGIK